MKFPRFRHDRRENDLDMEIRNHLDLAIRERIERGETPEQARSNALREFGNVGLVKEVTRDIWGWTSLDRLGQDLRFGWRMLRKNPGFSLIAILTLALGIGANTAIFTLLDKVLIRPLPVEQPRQLVVFAKDASGAPVSFSYPMFADLRANSGSLSGLSAYTQQPFSLSDGGQTERVIGQIVSGNYFEVLGVRPALGRFFLSEEDRAPGTHPVTIISYGLWQRRFGSDPAVIGKTISLNAYQYTVIGIAPREFTGTTRGTINDVYVPVMMQVQAQPGRNSKLEDRNSGWLNVFGRLKPETSRAQAQAALTAITAEAKRALPRSTDPAAIILVDGSRGFIGRITDLTLPLKLLMGVVGLVLLIACANIANLLLARSAVRRKELAIRLAIGASRWRIVRQLLTESMILAAIGGSAGLLVAVWMTRLLLGFQEQTNFVPRSLDGSLDGRVLWFTFGLSLLTGLVFGLAPALSATRAQFATALKEDSQLVSGSARWLSPRHILVVVQIALSLVVLIGAGLCVQSLRRLQAIDPGLEPAKVLTASFDLNLNRYNEARGQEFFAKLTERVAALPGVESVSLARGVAFTAFVWLRSATIEGYQPQPNERLAFDFNVITPNHFRTLGTPLVRGREFTPQDSADAPRVVIVNEATARRYWPNEEAVGKRVKYGNIDHFAEVVGVVRNTRDKGLIIDPRPAIYIPLQQQYMGDLTLHVRTASESSTMLAALRREAQALDAQLPVFNLMTLADQKDGLLYAERMAAILLTLFSSLALLLAAIGLYGVLSYAVTQRTRELGIRRALGAQAGDVLRLVIGQGMKLTLIGLVLGLAAAFALTRLLEKLLFGVSPTDPLTFAVIVLVLAAVAFVACWVPARRAAKVDPLTALRQD
jgi:macrolide transport system ATP-binding/permease protein